MWPKLHALQRLSSINTKSFHTLPFVALDAAVWADDYDSLLDVLEQAQLGPTVVVRSCAALEDAAPTEPPGFFESILDVSASDRAQLREAIDRVFGSYRRRPGSEGLPHKVIIQTQLLEPLISGVCRASLSASGYLEVDYDDALSRTDAVTAGLRAKRVYLSSCEAEIPQPWRALRCAVDAMRAQFAAPFFVEFAVGASGVPTVFQVRPDRRPGVPASGGRAPSCAELREAGARLLESGPLSVMADWNPAEMLGCDPKPLDVSLYDRLLMSGAWALGRTSVGWRAPSQHQLMELVGGRPFVKLAVSLETLLPQGIPSALARKLVRDRLRLLAHDPQLHDKVEFRVVWSAFAFDEAAVRLELLSRSFAMREIERLFEALKEVTRRTLEMAPRTLEEDIAGLASMAAHRRALAPTNVPSDPSDTCRTIMAALDACQVYGTVPFSRQARIAFSFRYIINHLVEACAITPESVHEWEVGLNTVARQLSADLSRVQMGTLSRASFNRQYGHLRPRTYSLESLRYDERAISGGQDIIPRSKRGRTPPRNRRLAELLSAVGADSSQERFWASAAGAFRAREELKFAFTALISDVLRLLSGAGELAGLKRQVLRRLTVSELLDLMQASESWPAFGCHVASAAGRLREPAQWRLPDVVFEPADFHLVRDLDARPTFIGDSRAEGPPRLITGEESIGASLAGAVIGIEAPDPGFDWIFAQPIAALITAYGGEFSHMGVRCAEFSIPAALGCGPRLFGTTIEARKLVIDGAAGEVWADHRRVYPV